MSSSRSFDARALVEWPRFDLALAGFFAVLSQLEVWSARDVEWSVAGRWTTVFLVLVAAGSLAFRRTRPFSAYLVNTAAVAAVSLMGAPVVFTVLALNLIGIYSVAAYAKRRHQWLSIGPAVGLVVVFLIAFARFGGFVGAALVVALWLAAWLSGRLYGRRLREVELIRERDATNTALVEERARLVVEEERNRLAGEIHDLLGHALNVIVMHAGAGRLAVDNSPAKARHVLETIEETGRSALGELDGMLDQMGSRDGGGNQPVPGIRDLESLSTRVAAADLPVVMEVDGDVSSVPPGVSFAVYRVVQEAITNTLRHARASSAEVSVAVTDTSVDVSVSDDGEGVGQLTPGRGLIGARERFALHGGDLRWRNRGRGGFTVEGHIPLQRSND